VTRDHCILSPDLYNCDVQRFERAFSEADQFEQSQSLEAAIPFYAQALELYGGPYMADILYGNGWCQEKRDRLTNSFIIAVERLAEHAYINAEYYQCVSLCEQVLDADQNIDDVTTWMMRSYSRLGRFTELEHVYRRYLLATTLDPNSIEGQQDLVVQTYLEIGDRRGLQREVGSI
jgi:DNA-binding SARP family transcriptional activator